MSPPVAMAGPECAQNISTMPESAPRAAHRAGDRAYSRRYRAS